MAGAATENDRSNRAIIASVLCEAISRSLERRDCFAALAVTGHNGRSVSECHAHRAPQKEENDVGYFSAMANETRDVGYVEVVRLP